MERAYPKRWTQATLAWAMVFVVGAVVFIFTLAALPADPDGAAGKSWWTAAVIGMAAMCLIIMGIQRRYRRQSEGMTLSIQEQVVIASE